MLKQIQRNLHIAAQVLAAGFVLWLAGCAEVQMRYNVLTYDNAIADTSNQLLLLNAVRASQRYPKSFTSVGQVVAGPQVTGGVGSTYNLSALTGLTTYSFSPTVAATPGYGQFALDNLNSQEFLDRLRKPVSDDIANSFLQSTTWPSELVNLIYAQEIHPTPAMVLAIHQERTRICSNPRTDRQVKLCPKLAESIDEFEANCTSHFSDINIRMSDFRRDPKMYYNTAVNRCHLLRFQIVLREMRLAERPACLVKKNPPPRCVPASGRSALQMIDYLGELIAAQSYIEHPFMPKLLYGRSTEQGSFEFVHLPIFVVNRGGSLERAAVSVIHEGELYTVPQPEFGSPHEARSLQTLDLVLQTVRAATTKADISKLPTIGIKQ